MIKTIDELINSIDETLISDPEGITTGESGIRVLMNIGEHKFIDGKISHIDTERNGALLIICGPVITNTPPFYSERNRNEISTEQI